MKNLLACILLLFFVMPVAAETPSFDAAKADKMVVRITDLKGQFRASGFYIGNDMIVTAHHVAQEQQVFPSPFGMQRGPVVKIEHLLVWDKQNNVALASVTYRDDEQDVAFLRLSNNKLQLEVATFAQEPPKRGDSVFIIGHPMRFYWALSRGYLSRIPLTMEDGEIRGLAAILAAPGSSGSPLFNEKGEVVGIVTQVLTSGGGTLYVPNSVYVGKIPTK